VRIQQCRKGVVVLSPASKTSTPPPLAIALHSSHKGGSLALGFVGSGSSWPSISIQTLKRKKRVTPMPVGENHVTVGGRKWVWEENGGK
jgi:hypothetical protein